MSAAGIVCRRLVSALVALAALHPASAEQLVEFDNMTQIVADRDKADTRKSETSIHGLLSKPTGPGPFPTVVLLHSCLGIPADHRAIGDLFASWGYVALFVDDFSTRGLHETCSVDFSAGVADAYGALAYLSKLPYVDPDRIAAVGYSQGADAVLQLASTGLPAAYPRGLHFSAGVAYYPPCANQANVRFGIPVLILIGKSDEVTPAADCELLAKTQSGARPRLKLVVYPGARHRFDDPKLAAGERRFGMWMQYNAVAADRSKREMRDFLAGALAR